MVRGTGSFRSTLDESLVLRGSNEHVQCSETTLLPLSAGQVWIVLNELMEERISLGVDAVVSAENSCRAKVSDNVTRRRAVRRTAPATRRA